MSKEEILVSVIIPVYNTEKYLRRCCDSVLSQTYHNLEVFLIDDGSTDGSGRICDDYATQDSRVHVIHKENAGQGVARNVALDMATGEYIAFVDSDDYIKPQMISLLVSTMQENNADMTIFGVINDHVFTQKKCPCMESLRVFNKEELFISYMFEPYVRGILWNKIYKADLFRDIRFLSIRAREDAEILYKIYGKVEKAVYIPDCLYVQYIRPGSTEQSSFNDAKLYTITIFREMAEYIRVNIPEISEYAVLLEAKACADVLNAIAQDNDRKKWMRVYEQVEQQLKQQLSMYAVHSDVIDDWYQRLNAVATDRKSVFKAGNRARVKNCVLLALKKIALCFC